MRHFRLTALARFSALALVVLWCVQPFTLALHAQEHTHRFCVEHNAFEEGVRAGAAAEPGIAFDGPTLERDATTPLAEAPHSGSHEECSATGSVSAPLLCPPHVLLTAARATDTRAPPRHGEALGAPVGILHVAPKGSPPVLLPSVA